MTRQRIGFAPGIAIASITLILAACGGNQVGDLSTDQSLISGSVGNDRSKSGTVEPFSIRETRRIRPQSAVTSGLYDFTGTHVVAVAGDGRVLGSSLIDAQGVFSLQAPKGSTVALMLANKGPSGHWVCQQDLQYQGATTDTFEKAVLKLDADVKAGDFAFNAINGRASSPKGEAGPYVASSAVFLSNDLNGYQRCGNDSVIESSVQMDFDFKPTGLSPDIKADDARFYQDAVVLGLDTSSAGTARFVGSTAPNDAGVATIRVRHERNETVKLSPTIMDARSNPSSNALLTPAWNLGRTAQAVTGSQSLGVLEGRFTALKGKVKDLIKKKAYFKYYMHGVGHYLGLDVHDAGRYFSDQQAKHSRPFEPGMVLTVEPGIYVPPDDKSAPAKFRGIGIRIEDDVLVTENGNVNLTSKVTKEVEEIEALMNVKKKK